MVAGLIIAGVGRSGTSTAAALAEQAGLRPPRGADMMSGNEWNPDGYWESASLVEFNDRLLSATSQNWWTPCPAERNKSKNLASIGSCTSRARQIFRNAFGGQGGWVWKDPRLTVLLPFWDRVLGIEPLLLPYRDPLGVAASISRRDGLSMELCLAIWERHSRHMLTTAAGHPVLFADYAQLTEQPDIWFGKLLEFCAESGLDVTEPKLDSTAKVRRIARPPANAVLTRNQADLAEVIVSLDGPHPDFQTPVLPEESPNTERLINTQPKLKSTARLRSQIYVRSHSRDVTR
ncbi:sulfotransferase family protein [Mycolicibacterium sp. HS_4_1]